MKKFFLLNITLYILLSELRLYLSKSYIIQKIPTEIINIINVNVFLNVVNIIIQLVVFSSLFIILMVVISIVYKFVFREKVNLQYPNIFSNIFLMLNTIYTTVIFLIVYFLERNMDAFYNLNIQMRINIFSPVNLIFTFIVYKILRTSLKKDIKKTGIFLLIINICLYFNTIIMVIILNKGVLKI